jgi:hypothetical protein
MSFEYIVLSVSHSDQRLTDRLTGRLEAEGHKVLLGQGAGDPQQQRQMEFAIERSDAFVLLLAPEPLAQDGAGRELALAQAADKPIFVVQSGPVTLPPELESDLAGRPLVDIGDDFDAGLEKLLALLAGEDIGVGQAEEAAVFGDDRYGEVPALPGEQAIWSEAGYYWFKKWKTLVRILAIQTGQRLLLFWDSRDIWKWKPREADELEEAFPMAIPLDQITAVGDVYRPKRFLIFTAAKPYVEIEVGQGASHKFSLQEDFEDHINSLIAVSGQLSADS